MPVGPALDFSPPSQEKEKRIQGQSLPNLKRSGTDKSPLKTPVEGEEPTASHRNRQLKLINSAKPAVLASNPQKNSVSNGGAPDGDFSNSAVFVQRKKPSYSSTW